MTIRDFIVDPNQPKENFQPENMANLVYSSLMPLKVEFLRDQIVTQQKEIKLLFN